MMALDAMPLDRAALTQHVLSYKAAMPHEEWDALTLKKLLKGLMMSTQVEDGAGLELEDLGKKSKFLEEHLQDIEYMD